MINGDQTGFIVILKKWPWKFRMKRTACSMVGFLTVVIVTVTFHNFISIPKRQLQSTTSKDMIHFMNINGFYYSAIQNATSGYGENGSSLIWREVWSHPGLDILHTPKIEYLPNFKNPCWYEPLTEPNVYQNNKYAVVSLNARRTMMELMQSWTKRLAESPRAKRLRCLPYFMIVGQPKCASTDIYKKIVKHPDVIAPPIKELHWWSRNRQGRKLNYTDIVPLSQYTDMFDKAALHIENKHDKTDDPDVRYHKKVTGDGSVSVFWENDDWWHFPENQGHTEPRFTNADYIHHVIPQVKIIISVRNPTDRLYSDYLFFTPANKSAEHFHDSVVYATEVYKNCTERHSDRFCAYNKTIAYLSKVRLRLGMYSTYLKDWLKVFPKEQIMVVTLEEYSKHMKKVMNKIYSFLNLRKLTKQEAREIIKQPRANKRKFKDRKVGAMLNETRKILDEFYKPYNKELADLLQDTKFLWQTDGNDDDDDDDDDDDKDDDDYEDA